MAPHGVWNCARLMQSSALVGQTVSWGPRATFNRVANLFQSLLRRLAIPATVLSFYSQPAGDLELQTTDQFVSFPVKQTHQK